MNKFTENEIKDAEFAILTAIAVRNYARAVERKRGPLTDAEVLERVSAEEKERFIRGKALHKAGAYRP